MITRREYLFTLWLGGFLATATLGTLRLLLEGSAWAAFPALILGAAAVFAVGGYATAQRDEEESK